MISDKSDKLIRSLHTAYPGMTLLVLVTCIMYAYMLHFATAVQLKLCSRAVKLTTYMYVDVAVAVCIADSRQQKKSE